MEENEKNYPEIDMDGSRFFPHEEEVETEEDLFLCDCLSCQIERRGEKK